MANIIASRQIRMKSGFKGMMAIHSNESIRKACKVIFRDIELANTKAFDKELAVACFDVKEETLAKAPCITMHPQIISYCYARNKEAKPPFDEEVPF